MVGLAVDTGEDGCEHHEVNFEEDLAVRGRRAEHDDPVSLRAELICLLGFLFRCLLWIDIQAVSHIFHG